MKVGTVNYQRKMTQHELRIHQNAMMLQSIHGEGVFLYENNTTSDIMLPKPASSGVRWVGPGKRFQGDSYFKSMIGRGLKLIKEIQSVPVKGKNMNEEKLILDQPETVTTKGTVEHVVSKKKQKLAEQASESRQDVLINEDPMEGVEIILN